MESWLLLLILAGVVGLPPLGWWATVAGFTLLVWWLARRSPRDEVQERAFAGRRAGLHRWAFWITVEAVILAATFPFEWSRGLLERQQVWVEGEGQGPVVLLIGGFLEGPTHMALLGRRLRARGLRPAWVRLPSTLRPIADNVAFVREVLAQLQQETGAEKIAIVGHSMGGVIGRTLVRRDPQAPVSVVVSVASPHRGTFLAARSLVPSARDMYTDSELVRELAPAPGPIPVHCLATYGEAVVSPPWSCVLGEGEDEVLAEPVGHVTVVFLPEVADKIAAWVTAAEGATSEAVTPA